MSSDTKYKDLLLLFLVANSLNILFLTFRNTGFAIHRPIIVYDYLFVVLCVILRLPTVLTFVIFFLISLLDVFNTISGNFLFNLTDFGRNLEFFFLYNFSAYRYFLLVPVVAFLAGLYWVLKKLVSKSYSLRATAIGLFAIVSVTYFLDAMNGRTLFFQHKIISISKFNIGGSSFVDLGIALNAYRQDIKRPYLLPSSITFETFATDSTSNQLIVLVESWGQPVRASDGLVINAHLENISSANGWKSSFGNRDFRGSTFHAELRELLGVYGDFRYFLKADSAKSFVSIFNIKSRQGYRTTAIHSFSSRMFQRDRWWKNIGVDRQYFLEEVMKEKEIQPSGLNSETPFLALNDEDAFNYLLQKVNTDTLHFDYFLTENSHLPYSGKRASESKHFTFEKEISVEANSQLSRILQTIQFIIERLEQGHWSKVLIVGDHMPPFTRSVERDFYSDKKIPYMILEKK